MLRRVLTVGLKLGLLAGVVAVVARALRRREDVRRRPPPPPWPPIDVGGEPRRAPAPSPAPEPPSPTSEPPSPAWLEPDDGACPASHPVKGNLRSGVFHLPGMAHYDRTNADRCYRDAGGAEADGLRQAKR